MFDGMKAGCAEHIKDIVAEAHRARGNGVDMAVSQIMGVLVIGAKHDALGMRAEKGMERGEIFGGGTFADQNFQFGGGIELFEGFLEREAFVIGGDAVGEIFSHGTAAQSGRMAVEGFPGIFGVGDFFEEVAVGIDDTGIVHHLGEVSDAGIFEEFADILGINFEAVGFVGGRGNAGGAPNIIFKGVAAALSNIN